MPRSLNPRPVLRPAALKRHVVTFTALGIGVYGCAESFRLGLGQLSDPGAGWWPLLVSATIIVFSLVVLFRHDPQPDTAPRNPRAVILAVLSLAVFVLLFQQVGLVVPTLLGLIFWLRLLANESWRLALTVSIVATAVFWFVFTGLGIPFPEGPFGF